MTRPETTVNPNRLLIVAVLGLAFIDCGITMLEGNTGEAAIVALLLAVMVFALGGFGGLAVYWLAMLASWVLAASLPILRRARGRTVQIERK